MGVLANGSVVVGDGTTDPVAITCFTTSTGLLIHERGGLEFDANAITDGGMIVGTASGTMAIRTGVLTGGASGFLKHELGGIEANISAITTDELLVGTSSGVIAVRTASQVRTHLSLVPGTDIQTEDLVLTDLAALSAVADNEFIVGTGAGTYAHEAAATALVSMGAQAQDDHLDDLAALSTVSAADNVMVSTGSGAWALESGNTMRTSFGLAIGTDVQAEDPVLTDIAALSAVADNEFIVGTGAGTYAHESGATLRTSIGVGTGDTVEFNTVFINETANANMTVGLTINQGANDDQIFALKSSDVAHGLTTATLFQNAETDDFLTISKISATAGGAFIQSLSEDSAVARTLVFETYGGQAQTNKTTAAVGLIDFYASEIASANVLGNITADGNIFVVRRRIGDNDQAAFIVDEDGDLYADGTTGTGATVGLFDVEDDIALCRAFDLQRADRDGLLDQIVRQEWDDWALEHKDRLVDLRIIGADGPDGERGLVNVTQLQRLHNGAICQLHTANQKLLNHIATLLKRLEITEQKLTLLSSPI